MAPSIKFSLTLAILMTAPAVHHQAIPQARESIWRGWTNPSRPATISTRTPTADGSKRRRFPPTSRATESTRSWPTKPASARSSLIEDAAKAGRDGYAERRTRSAISTRASWMRAAIESQGNRAAQARNWTRSRRSRIAMRWPRAMGAQLRADVDALNSTNFETGNLFGIWVTQGLTDPSHTYPYLLQGGLGHARSRLLSFHVAANGGACASKYLAHIEAMFKLAGFNDPSGARRARVCARNRDGARCMPRASNPRTCTRAVSWNRADLPPRRRGSTGPRCSKPRD